MFDYFIKYSVALFVFLLFTLISFHMAYGRDIYRFCIIMNRFFVVFRVSYLKFLKSIDYEYSFPGE